MPQAMIGWPLCNMADIGTDRMVKLLEDWPCVCVVSYNYNQGIRPDQSRIEAGGPEWSRRCLPSKEQTPEQRNGMHPPGHPAPSNARCPDL